jgi:hypothetical protein
METFTREEVISQQYDEAAAMLKRVKAKCDFVDLSKEGLKKLYKSEVLVKELMSGLDNLAQFVI